MGAVIFSGAVLVVALAGVLIGLFGMPKTVATSTRFGASQETKTNYARRILITAAVIVAVHEEAHTSLGKTRPRVA